MATSVWSCGSDPDVRLVLEFLDQNGQRISEVSSQPSAAMREWEMLRVEAVTPEGSHAANLSLQVRAPGHATFDDAALAGGHLANSGFEEGWSAWSEGDKNDNVGIVWINDTNFVPWV